MKLSVVVSVVALSCVAGCSSGSSGGSSAPQPTGTATTASQSAPPATGASNLVLTQQVRQQLIHTYAHLEQLPDSAYTGLAKGTAYYAVDNTTGIHWAGASLVPSQTSQTAQVSVQDDGGYLLFEQKPGGAWTVNDVGLQGQADAIPCPVTPPADVLSIWHWAKNACNPYMKATPPSDAVNLPLTQQVRAELIHAKAVEAGVSDSAYTGLAKGTAYYAVDNATDIYWAAGSVVPSKHSVRAQVSSQDEGAYDVFERKPGGAWQIFEVGLDGPGPRTGSQCPVTVPADVLQVWHWKANSCDPPSAG